jgi:hypothetical protein
MIEMNKNSRDAAGIVKDCGTKKALTGAPGATRQLRPRGKARSSAPSFSNELFATGHKYGSENQPGKRQTAPQRIWAPWSSSPLSL